MDNSDKIFEKIKKASLNQEVPDFQSMDKVWSRVENKLDNKVLKKENKLWKKIAVAASFLFVFTVSYQIFLPKEDTIIKNNQTVSEEPEKKTSPLVTPEKQINEDVVETQSNQQKNNIPSVKQQQPLIIPPAAEAIVIQPAVNTEQLKDAVAEPDLEIRAIEKEESKTDQTDKKERFQRAKLANARSVRHDKNNIPAAKSSETEPNAPAEKDAPLLIVDGKSVTGKAGSEETLKQGLSKLDPNDIEDIVVLSEPLYIINGSHYSERELFGPNPTSPYYPLNQQEIESLSILQGEKAIAAYGKKGAKGVVIISTKNGKPIKPAVRRE